MVDPGYYNPVSAEERTRLVQSHLSILPFIVDRMTLQVPSFMSREDVTSAAMMGLMDAANRFDPSRGVLFKTFAELRIRGAIFDEVRRMDWFSRSLREKQSRLTRSIEMLEHRLGRSPEEYEIAEAMGLALEAYRQLLCEVSHLGCVSLNETLDESEEGKTFLDSLVDARDLGALEGLERQELTRQLAACIEALSEKERLVVSLVYYEELSQKEVSEVLGVTEGRVSQLHSQALAKLRVKFSKALRGPS